ncbi:MAG: hypothetical protein GF383_10310 [Candidatus Lokiarchaeota archaeon]|nr:hypothetical protein [Candidatus Lokiarchaeota archaeon]MBD3340949.1 hypothetical protein [Candidatus Lokiarchaeota archaeon]
MNRKGNKFSRYNSKEKNISEKNKKKYSSRYYEPCGCGSGRIFGKCCYRSDHRIFNLERYLSKLKNIKLKMHDLVLAKFLELYEEIPEIREITDSLSDYLRIPSFNNIVNDILMKIEYFETSADRAASAIRCEALTIDWTLPKQDKPLLQDALRFYLVKASKRKKECYDSYANSQFSLYEVIKGKKFEDSPQYTWIMVRDLFTKEKYVIKDPLICGQVHIWDVIIGRLYTVADFHLFSTSTFILSTDQMSIFNRILFLFWLKENLEENPSLLDELDDIYPNLSRDFSHIGSNFNGKYLLNEQISQYLKYHSPSLIEIMNLIHENSPNYTPHIKSPDNEKFIWAESIGELQPDKVLRAIEILRTKGKSFSEVPKTDRKNEASFDFLLNYVEIPKKEIINTSVTPKALAYLDNEEIACKILELLQKNIIINSTPIISSWSLKKKASHLPNLISDSNVRVGSVEIINNTIRLVSYSKKSMKKMWKKINSLLKPCLAQLAPPTYSDFSQTSQMSRSEQDFDYLTSMRNEILEEQRADSYQKLDLLLGLENSLDSTFQDEGDDDSLHLESRELRRFLIKQWKHQKIPVLEGLSPQEAIKRKEYVPLVIDLIKVIENNDDINGDYDFQNSYMKSLGINPFKDLSR